MMSQMIPNSSDFDAENIRIPPDHAELRPSKVEYADYRSKRARVKQRLTRLTRLTLILVRARGLYADVCDELDRTDPESDEYCLLLSNGADDLASLISGLDMLREASGS